MQREPFPFIKASALAVGLCLSPLATTAQGVPTNDAQAILRQIQQYQQMLEDYGVQTEQLTQLTEQLAVLEEQLTRLTEIQSLLEDPSQILSLIIDPKLAGILEGDFDVSMIETLMAGLNGDWSSVTGSSSGTFIGAIEDALSSAGTSQEAVTEMANSGNENAERNAQQTTSNAMTSAAAEVAYREAEQLVERTVILVDEIAELETLKESVDHNTRVTAELAIALAAIWQLESVQTMNVGLTGVADAATIAKAEKFYDFTLPDLQ